MSLDQSFEPAVLFAIAVFGVAIAGIAVVLVLSARSANQHLTNATKLSGPLPVQSADAAQPRDGGPPHPADSSLFLANALDPSKANWARLVLADREDADGSRTTFALLNEYYAANVIHGNMIFWASLLSMIVGFAFISFGIFKANTSSTTALVAGIAGVFSQFIAATFLVALRSTQEQSTTYAQTLVQLRIRDVRAAADAQSVTLGLALLNEISADGADALANQTRAVIATALITKTGAAAPQSPAAAAADAAPSLSDAKTRTRAGVITFDTAESPDATRT